MLRKSSEHFMVESIIISRKSVALEALTTQNYGGLIARYASTATSLCKTALPREERVILLGPLHTEDGKSSEDAESAIFGKQAFRRIMKFAIGRSPDVPRAFLPSWIYQIYDSYCLAQKAADRWKKIVRVPSMDGFVRKPDLLSFHNACKIPVSESLRQDLLEIDGISYRLRHEIELLESFDCIRCETCEALIARRTDMLVMSNEGPLGAYVNSHGFVHEVMTLQKANGLAVIEHPVKEHS